MKLPNTKFLVLNGAAVMLIGAAVVTQIKHVFQSSVITPCSERFTNAIALGVERNGGLLTPVDIQASAGGTDYGVIDHLTIARVTGAPRPVAFSVAMPAGSAHPDHTREKRGGIQFPWRPRALPANVEVACLSYDILLPADFDFGSGVGTLPGVGGASAQIGAVRNERFSVHFGWGNQGVARLKSTMAAERTTHHSEVGNDKKIPRGRWVRVDQEIALNTPGKGDGGLRLWLDGSLIGEVTDVILRESPDTSIEKVLVEAHFGASRSMGDGKAIKDERIQFTPFEVRW